MNTQTLDRDIYERVKTEIDIVGLIGETFTVRGRGRILTTQEHDSLKIYTNNNSFAWFSQGGKGGKVAGGSPIDWVMHRDKCSQEQATELLAAMLGVMATAGARPARRLVMKQPLADCKPVIREASESDHEWRSAEWQKEKVKLVEDARESLANGRDERGREYMEVQRCLEMATCLAFRIGYMLHWNADVKRKEPAIVFPWYTHDGRTLRGVRFRFLKQYQIGIKPNGEPKMSAKTTSVEGAGQFFGAYFGTQALTRWDEEPTERASYGSAPADYVGIEKDLTLLLNEGEINTLSIWQESQDTGAEVLGFGAERPTLTKPMIDFAKRYGTLITWMDEPERVKAVGAAFNCKNDLGSKDRTGAKRDANDRLRNRELGGMLAAYRFNKAKDSHEQQRLLWNYVDKARGWFGIDGGSADVICDIAAKLGKSVQLAEVRPGCWRVLDTVQHTEIAPTVDRPPLPAELWESGIEEFSAAWARWYELSQEYKAAMGKNRDGYYIQARGPGHRAATQLDSRAGSEAPVIERVSA